DEIRELNPQYRKDVIPGNLKASSLVLPSLQVYAYIANEDSILNHNASRYARRNVVEPADGITLTGTDAHGEYVEEQTIEYHTVGRNENLSSIAKKYGVTVSSIRQNNKIGKSVRKGQRLKIVITKRQYKESELEPVSVAIQIEPPVNPADTAAIINNNNAATVAKPDSVVNTSKPEPAKNEKSNTTQKTQQKANQQKSTQPKAQQQPSKQQKTTQSRPSTYTIASGDNLYKISKRFGVSIEDLKKANGMTNDKLRAGQTLKIPSK
ncbi:MAG: LysM peptidoglycan-binding domain-containing protein, partial [Muribaculaceae bacterium]|nr:LysM peptidoglycan-binding domain-containing protein [Muribaculaceae bacterium]